MGRQNSGISGQRPQCQRVVRRTRRRKRQIIPTFLGRWGLFDAYPKTRKGCDSGHTQRTWTRRNRQCKNFVQRSTKKALVISRHTQSRKTGHFGRERAAGSIRGGGLQAENGRRCPPGLRAAPDGGRKEPEDDRKLRRGRGGVTGIPE